MPCVPSLLGRVGIVRSVTGIVLGRSLTRYMLPITSAQWLTSGCPVIVAHQQFGCFLQRGAQSYQLLVQHI